MKSSSLTINQLSTAIINLDGELLITDLNHSAEQVLGLSRRQLVGKPIFGLITGEFNQALLSQFMDKNMSTSVQDIVMELPKGSLTVNLIITPINSDKPKIKSGCLLEIQSSETPQNIKKDQRLQQQSRVSEHLIRNLAHEIKNPLGGIKGAGQLLERKLPSDFSKKYTQIIIRESNRLSDLVDRLLMPAKIENNQLTNIHLLLEHALDVLLLQKQQHKIDIVKDYDPSIPDLMLAPNQIEQALINLIKNAIEAVIQDFKSSQIVLRTRIKNRHTIGDRQHRQVLKVDIEDNGSGVKKDLVNDIFFPTISSKQSSGLGLSIAQSLVQRHLGIIELEQKNNVTCFSLFLPMMTK
ncbi:MAG: two-component system nitrogen regulation sensor histidine kinase GlnL [Polaribacter sp.]|jgi:two-component system nitrogen regulation sensor histidine kinase GlnL